VAQYVPLGTVAAPASWTIPPSLEIALEAVFAHFDGSGAGGSFLPTLQIVSDSGHTVCEIPMDASVAAGSSVEATWAPFLRGAQAAAAGTTFYGARVTQQTQQTFPAGGNTAVTWDTLAYDTSPGGTMWNAGTPTLLTVPADGIYLVVASMSYTQSASGNVVLNIQGVGQLTAMNNDPENTAFFKYSAFPYVQQCVANATLKVFVQCPGGSSATSQPANMPASFSLTRIA